jgi:hypothetical protein
VVQMPTQPSNAGIVAHLALHRGHCHRSPQPQLACYAACSIVCEAVEEDVDNKYIARQRQWKEMEHSCLRRDSKS